MERYINFIAGLLKTKYSAFNVLITAGLAISIAFGLLLTFAYEIPTDFEQKSGTVANFDQFDEKWYHTLFGYTQGSHFEVEFTDGSYFEATGICYDCIDVTLFEQLQKGDQMKLIYHDDSISPNRIYAIEYMGKEYLALDDVEAEFLKNQSISYVAGPCLMGACAVAAVVFYVVNYQKNKKKRCPESTHPE